MELLQLRYFQTVARLGHMTKAAEVLHVAQPSLSRSIARLEQEIGVPLFERTGRRIRLNQFGEILLSRVELLFTDLERVRREIADLYEEVHGLITLAVSQSSALYMLPALLGRFRNRYPETRVQVTTYQDTPHGRYAVFKQLEEGKVNLCLCPSVSDGTGSTEWQPVIRDELVLAVPSGHHLAKNEQFSFSEIADEPCICLSSGTSFRDLTDTMYGRASILPTSMIEIEDLNTVIDLVASGAGVALVPALLMKQRERPGSVLLRLEGGSTQWIVGVAWDQRAYLPVAAQLFRRLLVDFSV